MDSFVFQALTAMMPLGKKLSRMKMVVKKNWKKMGKERFFWEKAGRLRADSQRVSHCGIRVRNSMLPRNPRMYQMRCFRNSRSPFVSPFHSTIRERWRRGTRSFSSRLGSLAIFPRSKLNPRPKSQGLPYAHLPIMAPAHPGGIFSIISWICLGAFSGGIRRICSEGRFQ